jgi:mannitol/fructose-specific phosphotransferase system IIA component (Ntr-type)
VLLPLEAADKWAAIALIAQAPVRAGRVQAALQKGVEQALVQREKSMTTGMEHGIAIPHAAVDGIDDLVAVLAISPAGIPFEALDHRPAQILVGLIIPRQKKLLHIRTLAEIARLLARSEVRQRLLQCRTPGEALLALQQLDGAPAS